MDSALHHLSLGADFKLLRLLNSLRLHTSASLEISLHITHDLSFCIHTDI